MAFTSIPETNESPSVKLSLGGTVAIDYLPHTGHENLPAGSPVELRADGKIQHSTNTNLFLGYVAVKQQRQGYLTVETRFLAILPARSKGAVARGALLKSAAVADTLANKRATFETAVATNLATGIALSAGTDAEIEVGLLPAPYLVP